MTEETKKPADELPEGITITPVPDKSDKDVYITYLESMIEDTMGLPEAGAVVWGDIWGVAKDTKAIPHLVKWNLTVRSKTSIGALKAMARGVGWAQKNLHFNPWVPEFGSSRKPQEEPAPVNKPPAPANKPATPPVPVRQPVRASGEPEQTDSEDGEVTFLIKTIERKIWKGDTYISVAGGKWSKFGVACYPEVLGEYPLFEGWETWEVGVQYGPLDGLEKAVVEIVDGKPKKILRFLPK